MSQSAIEQAKSLLEERAKELRAELAEIDRAIGRLPKGASKRGGPRRAAKASPGRRRRKGARAEEAVKVIAANPGIGINDLTSKLGLKGPHYLYRLLPRLEEDGRIRKDGDGYRAV